MALLRGFLVIVVCIAAAPVHGHHMGRTVPIGFSDSGFPHVHLAAQVIASYFEEQMGRNMELSAEISMEKCLDSILAKEMPMAVVPLLPAEKMPDGVVVVIPGIDAGKGIITLVMGTEAKQNLQFSLVPKYMEKLADKLSTADWEKGLARVDSGEGVRKVALDMLRESDLL